MKKVKIHPFVLCLALTTFFSPKGIYCQPDFTSGNYMIKVRHSGKVLEIANMDKQKSDIRQNEYKGLSSQIFRRSGSNIINIYRVAEDNERLRAAEGSDQNGARIRSELYPQGNIGSFSYRLEKSSGGYYFIKGINGKYLEIKGGSRSNGAYLVQNKFTGAANQQFKFEPAPPNYRKLRTTGTTTCSDHYFKIKAKNGWVTINKGKKSKIVPLIEQNYHRPRGIEVEISCRSPKRTRKSVPMGTDAVSVYFDGATARWTYYHQEEWPHP